MLDTSILIDYFRRTIKEKSRMVQIFQEYQEIHISAITEFEIFNGMRESHRDFWETLMSRITVLDFDSKSARKAAQIVIDLKVKRKSIDKPDLFIAATAIVNNLVFETLNEKHFKDIGELKLLKEN